MLLALALATACNPADDSLKITVLTDGPCRQEIVAVERDWADHVTDPAFLDTLLAPEFTHSLPGGESITKPQQIAYVTSHAKQLAGDARLNGIQVIAQQVDDSLQAIVSGYITRGHGHTARATYFTDVFVLRDGRWQAVAANEDTTPVLPL